MPSAHKKRKKKSNILFYVFLLIFSVPLFMSVLSNSQEIRSQAATGTRLAFQPNNNTPVTIHKNVGDPIDLDMYIIPENNPVVFVKYKINFDPTKVKLVAAHPFTINTSAFSNIDGPDATQNSLTQSLATGTDLAKVIRTPTKVGTIHFVALAKTGSKPTTVTFNVNSQAFTTAIFDGSIKNILSSATPASIVIGGSGSNPGTTTAGAAPTPKMTPKPGAPTATPTKQPTITQAPTPTTGPMQLSFSLLLDGVGNAGDHTNPGGNAFSNKSPLHTTRDVEVQVYTAANFLVIDQKVPATYTPSSGTFNATMNITTIPPDTYTIKLKTARYLRKSVPETQTLTAGQTTTVPEIELTAGDINGDNKIDALDYNALLDCGFGKVNPKPNSDQTSVFKSSTCQAHTEADNVDINDNGVIDSADYNLFIREMSEPNGD